MLSKLFVLLVAGVFAQYMEDDGMGRDRGDRGERGGGDRGERGGGDRDGRGSTRGSRFGDRDGRGPDRDGR